MSRLFKSLLVLAAALAAVPALAGAGWKTYSAGEFQGLQSQGKTIVADVRADWCPTCRAQQPTLEALRTDPRLRNVVFVRVDFDRDTDFLRRFRIPRQSTIVVFKGNRETARSVAETRPAQLRAAVLAGL